MDQGDLVQEQNLVDDQVTQALTDSGAEDAASNTPQVASPVAPTVQPLSEQTDAQPEATPLTAAPASDDQSAEPSVVPLTAATATDAPVADTLPTPAPVTAPVPTASDAAIETPQEELPDLSAPATPTPAAKPVIAPNLGEGTGQDDELMSVKQQALEQLSPLVSHLDLPADQKFDTYMEIIRASDDKTLIQPAFDAAQSIEDEDKKAQALLDVVNEVNYLTQDHNEEDFAA